MKFESLRISPRENKRFMISFSSPKRIIHFGQFGGSTYIDHKDKTKRSNYLKRHQVREDWDNVNAGSLSAFVLWGPTTSITENLVKYLERFGIEY
jgi:hypothetical protein